MQNSAREKLLNKVANNLTAHSYRVTRSRLAVAKTLLSSNGAFLTPEEIHREVTDAMGIRCDLTSVYRSLALYEGLGLVVRTEFHSEAARYGWRSDLPIPERKHVHFFKCDRCQKVEPLANCLFEEFAESLAERGFTNLEHRFEVTGVCPKCR
jgi:Fe2+ or Zn2+ uptake regulation protein